MGISNFWMTLNLSARSVISERSVWFCESDKTKKKQTPPIGPDLDLALAIAFPR